MAESKVVVGEFKKGRRFSLAKHKRKLLIALGVILFLTPGSVLLVRHYLRDRHAKNTPDTSARPEQGPEDFVASQKEAITKSDVSETQKIEQRTAAANYFSNTYDFQRVLSELDLVAKEYPAASENYFYLVSYFTVLVELNHTDEMKVYAKRIVTLEAKGAKLIAPIPEAVRKAIDENSR
jgi:hypothetical protein